MKKCTSILLTFLLLVSTSGMSFNVHFCGDRIASVSSGFAIGLSDAEAEPEMEGCCIEKARDGEPCCSDKEVKIDSKPEPVSKQELAKIFFLSPGSVSYLSVPELTQDVSAGSAGYYFEPNGPPLYKLYHKYVFYA